MPAAASADAVLLTELVALDTILIRHAAALAGDVEAYRNHAYRVANLCASQSSGTPEAIEQIAITAACHDLGIWTAGTFDYLDRRSASPRLPGRGGPRGVGPAVAAAIGEHHKVTRYRGEHERSSSPFAAPTGWT